MSQGQLKIATCQFAVSDSISKNAQQIQAFMGQAAREDADIVHFSEAALSGYGGHEILNYSKFKWDVLEKHTKSIMALAKQLGIYVVLGSTHRLTEPNKPYNCLYLVNSNGEIQDRYDKRFLTSLDVGHYSAGDHFVVFEINGVRCALLICFDLRFPELYREVFKLDVDVVLQSFYNARQDGPSVHTHIMRQTMQTRAAENYFWVSMTNSCRYYSPYPSCFIRPDGKIVKQLKQNTQGMMINIVNLTQEFYDPMIDIRKKVLDGDLSYGDIAVDDPRADRGLL